MRFISKASNYRIILRAGIPADHLLGRLHQPAVAVLFVHGVADVQDASVAEMLKAHESFNRDFILAEEGTRKDPYASTRKDVEPVHVITEMQFGTPVKRTVGASAPQIPEALQALINAEAQKLALTMAPGMAKEMLRTFASQQKQVEPEKDVMAPISPPGEESADELLDLNAPTTDEEKAEMGIFEATAPRGRGRPKKSE